MFDEVTVCEVADSGGTGFESRDGLGEEEKKLHGGKVHLTIVWDRWNIFGSQSAISFSFSAFHKGLKRSCLCSR